MVINDKMFSFLLHLRKLSLPRWPGTTNAELLMLHTIVAVEDQTLRRHSEKREKFPILGEIQGEKLRTGTTDKIDNYVSKIL